MKYKILFIDEEKDQHDNFLDYMDKIEDKVEVKCLYPDVHLQKPEFLIVRRKVA